MATEPKRYLDYIVPVLLTAITILLGLFINELKGLSGAVTDLKVSIATITSELQNTRENQTKLRQDFDSHEKEDKEALRKMGFKK